MLYPANLEALCVEFREHCVPCDAVILFDILMEKLKEVLITLAVDMLSLDGVHDFVNQSLPSFCPHLLHYSDEKVVDREVRQIMVVIVDHNHIMLYESDELLKGFVGMFWAYWEKTRGRRSSTSFCSCK